MAQGEFWVERQNWARWPRVLKVNRHTDHGTETKRYLPERHEAAWSEREYAIGKIAELEAENAKLRELASGIGHLLFSLDVDYCAACPRDGINHSCPVFTVDGGECLYKTDLRELGVEV